MSATVGNQFWKLRSKHGRDKIFSSPEVLWEAAVEYFEATDKRKWIRKEFNGKDAKECELQLDTPYTHSAFMLFIDIDDNTWSRYRKDYQDFREIITRIERIIYSQKFEGATVGSFNANIIARDLKLVDKSEIKIPVVGKEAAEEEKYD